MKFQLLPFLFFCAFTMSAQTSFRNASASFAGASNASAVTTWTTSAHYSPDQFNRVVSAGTAMQSAAESEMTRLNARIEELQTQNAAYQTQLRNAETQIQELTQQLQQCQNPKQPDIDKDGDKDAGTEKSKSRSLQAQIGIWMMDNWLIVLLLVGIGYYVYKRKQEGKPLL